MLTYDMKFALPAFAAAGASKHYRHHATGLMHPSELLAVTRFLVPAQHHRLPLILSPFLDALLPCSDGDDDPDKENVPPEDALSCTWGVASHDSDDDPDKENVPPEDAFNCTWGIASRDSDDDPDKENVPPEDALICTWGIASRDSDDDPDKENVPPEEACGPNWNALMVDGDDDPDKENVPPEDSLLCSLMAKQMVIF